MHPARAVLMLTAMACTAGSGAWREQYIFVGDDGTVLALCVQIPSGGPGEAKGWLGQSGAWRSTFYSRFSVAGRDPSDLPRALEAWSTTGDAPVRVTLTRTPNSAAITLRTPSASYRLDAATLTTLGQESDPEGVSLYRAGRASLDADGGPRAGWLLVESTPADRPHRPFVSYGDFAFLAAAGEGTVVLLKHATGRAGFDHALVQKDGRVRRTEGIQVERRADRLVATLPALDMRFAFAIRDRAVSRGVAPDGTPVSYETALLAGAAAGVAFAIRPAAAEAPP